MEDPGGVARQRAYSEAEQAFVDSVNFALRSERRIEARQRVLFAALESTRWIDRQVTRYCMRDDGCTHRHDSFDMRVPGYLVSEPFSPGGAAGLAGTFTVPVCLVAKDPVRHNISVRNHKGWALSAINTAEQAQLVAVVVIDMLMKDRGPADLMQTEGRALAPRGELLALQINDLVASTEAARHAEPSDELRTAESTIVAFQPRPEVAGAIYAILTEFDSFSLLAVEMSSDDAAQPQIVKFGSGQGLPRERERVGKDDTRFSGARGLLFRGAARIGVAGASWSVHETLLVRDSDFGNSRTRHFEYEAARGLLVQSVSAIAGLPADVVCNPNDVVQHADLQKFLGRLDSETRTRLEAELLTVGVGGKAVWVGHISGARGMLALGTPAHYSAAKFLWYLVDVRAERGALVYVSRYGAFATLAFAIAGIVSNSVTSGAEWFGDSWRIGSILFTLAVALLAWLGIGREHPVASDLLRPFRRAVVGAAACAALLAVLAFVSPDVALWQATPWTGTWGANHLQWLAEWKLQTVGEALVGAVSLGLALRVRPLRKWTIQRRDSVSSVDHRELVPRPRYVGVARSRYK